MKHPINNYFAYTQGDKLITYWIASTDFRGKKLGTWFYLMTMTYSLKEIEECACDGTCIDPIDCCIYLSTEDFQEWLDNFLYKLVRPRLWRSE